VFGEIFNQANQDIASWGEVVPDAYLEFSNTPGQMSDGKFSITAMRSNMIAPSFNPFEVAQDPEIQNQWRPPRFLTNKSRSDVGYLESFLDKIEDAPEDFLVRRSEVVNPSEKFIGRSQRVISDMDSSYTDKEAAMKFSFDTPSGNESSTKVNNSVLSSEILNNGRKNIMINKLANDGHENTPTFTDAPTNLVSIH